MKTSANDERFLKETRQSDKMIALLNVANICVQKIDRRLNGAFYI